MYAINAIYDGKQFTPTQPLEVTEKYKVIITFIEPLMNESKQEDGEKKLNLLDLIGKIEFAEGYDYKSMRGKIT
ncbi:MAG: hypothetical protein FWC16_02155 [Defluviitaleaceae bacterium]|nr:hypothetical protein [Defluviitaleaceae bacterium]MCL2273702.1 hypothetical protein [Defluviitaleaceae bacterium]